MKLDVRLLTLLVNSNSSDVDAGMKHAGSTLLDSERKAHACERDAAFQNARVVPFHMPNLIMIFSLTATPLC